MTPPLFLWAARWSSVAPRRPLGLSRLPAPAGGRLARLEWIEHSSRPYAGGLRQLSSRTSLTSIHSVRQVSGLTSCCGSLRAAFFAPSRRAHVRAAGSESGEIRVLRNAMVSGKSASLGAPAGVRQNPRRCFHPLTQPAGRSSEPHGCKSRRRLLSFESRRLRTSWRCGARLRTGRRGAEWRSTRTALATWSRSNGLAGESSTPWRAASPFAHAACQRQRGGSLQSCSVSERLCSKTCTSCLSLGAWISAPSKWAASCSVGYVPKPFRSERVIKD